MQETITVELVEVAPFKALAVRTGMTPDKSGTRVAWSKLTEHVPLMMQGWQQDRRRMYSFRSSNGTRKSTRFGLGYRL